MTTDPIIRDYAPKGVLRVALNHGNRVLVHRDGKGQPYGISVDLARELGRALQLDLTFVEFERAIDVSSTVANDVWDVCFLAVDPKRAEEISFTSPYVCISGCYLVSASTDVSDGLAVVANGLRIGAVEGSAYTLHLARQPGAEHLVIFPTIFAALEALDAERIDGVAGVQQAMESEAATRPRARVLQPPFMDIRQAMGMPAGRAVAAAHLRSFLSDLARRGKVADILEAYGVSRDCAVVIP